MSAPSFSTFVAIDWSGAKGRRQRGIAIAMCGPGTAAPVLVREGHTWSREEVLDWLLHHMPANSLAGLDLSPSLPFEDCDAYFPGWEESPSDARALWALVDRISADDADLAATSFVDHLDASRHFRRHGGRTGDRFGAGPGRFRRVERRQREYDLSPYSCMNLVGAAQVGKSSLTGMRMLNRLSGHLPVWPFDPLPRQGSVVVEIYTSLAARAAKIPRGRAKMRDASALDTALVNLDVDRHRPLMRYDDHATDAILTAAWLRRVAHDPVLWNPAGLDEVAQTEGWTFGII